VSLFPKDRDLSKSLEQVELAVRASDFRCAIEELEIRLDAFLAHHLTWRSRSSLQQLVREGQVLVSAPGPEQPDAEPAFEVELRPGRYLRHGVRVRILIPEASRLEPTSSEPGDLAILYEDDEVLAVDKPPLMVVHPSGRYLTGTLIQRVHARYRKHDDERVPIRLCHRLDRETSGIVLLAKDPLLHPLVMAQFEGREVEKEYLAIVHGHPDPGEGKIDLPLGSARASAVMIKMTVREDGMESQTGYRVLERRKGCALVLCRLYTGRQHQIRVHMAALGHPLIGDKLYGEDEGVFLRELRGELTSADRASLDLQRHALHAHRLVFTTPKTGKRIEVVSPLANDMREWFERRPAT
jgi:RluA family pseudouridine synthase